MDAAPVVLHAAARRPRSAGPSSAPAATAQRNAFMVQRPLPLMEAPAPTARPPTLPALGDRLGKGPRPQSAPSCGRARGRSAAVVGRCVFATAGRFGGASSGSSGHHWANGAAPMGSMAGTLRRPPTGPSAAAYDVSASERVVRRQQPRCVFGTAPRFSSEKRAPFKAYP